MAALNHMEHLIDTKSVYQLVFFLPINFVISSAQFLGIVFFSVNLANFSSLSKRFTRILISQNWEG
jgi:hypothetical protein